MLRRTAPRRGDWQKYHNEALPQFALPAARRPMNLLNPDFGFRRGALPRFAAATRRQRQVMLQRMVTELVRRDHVIVAGARGPALRVAADHLVSLAKRGDTGSRQEVSHFLLDPLLVDKAFDEMPGRFADYNGGYTMMSKLTAARRRDGCDMWFVEFKNRPASLSHAGEIYEAAPERFFLPPKVAEDAGGVRRPPHHQMAFDRWAERFKTEEFHDWWRTRHAKMRFWGMRNVPHPSEVEPLWSEHDEDEYRAEAGELGGARAYNLDGESWDGDSMLLEPGTGRGADPLDDVAPEAEAVPMP